MSDVIEDLQQDGCSPKHAKSRELSNVEFGSSIDDILDREYLYQYVGYPFDQRYEC